MFFAQENSVDLHSVVESLYARDDGKGIYTDPVQYIADGIRVGLSSLSSLNYIVVQLSPLRTLQKGTLLYHTHKTQLPFNPIYFQSEYTSVWSQTRESRYVLIVRPNKTYIFSTIAFYYALQQVSAVQMTRHHVVYPTRNVKPLFTVL
jgi:hypothetical protein